MSKSHKASIELGYLSLPLESDDNLAAVNRKLLAVLTSPSDVGLEETMLVPEFRRTLQILIRSFQCLTTESNPGLVNIQETKSQIYNQVSHLQCSQVSGFMPTNQAERLAYRCHGSELTFLFAPLNNSNKMKSFNGHYIVTGYDLESIHKLIPGRIVPGSIMDDLDGFTSESHGQFDNELYSTYSVFSIHDNVLGRNPGDYMNPYLEKNQPLSFAVDEVANICAIM
jgi:hypothetical protein